MKKTTTPILAGLLLVSAGDASAIVHYVDLNSTNATPPFTNWSTAATNIQDAVDAAVAGEEIVVTNGIYSTGARQNTYIVGDLDRVSVDKPLTIRSINGPQFTTIDGSGLVRCVYLTNGATLSGFTLTNGFSWLGGGALCRPLAVVSNCVITGNSTIHAPAGGSGGGAFGGTLNDCALDENQGGGGGGASNCTLNNCTLRGNSARNSDGGGAAGCTLNNCTLSSNRTDYGNYRGGGVYSCVLNNCTLTGNSAGLGGGAYSCTLNNCTLNGNSADNASGAANCTLNNCTLAGNTTGAALQSGVAVACTLNNCIKFGNSSITSSTQGPGVCEDCDSPGRLDGNNWVGDPLFVDTNGWANLRLQSNSPCINAGNNAYARTGPDLDGNPRIVGGTVDIGAYEYQSLSLINFGVISNQAGFSITGQSNQVVIVETSTDLLNWSPLVTNTLNGHPFPFSDPTPANLPRRFYRAQSQ